MTSARVRPHVAHVLERTHAVLVPFDGTLCDLVTEVDTAAVAERIRDGLFAAGHRMTLLTSLLTDPLWMLAYAHDVGRDHGAAAEEIVREAETAAAVTAAPTSGIHEVLRACQAGGRPVAVVGGACSAAMEAHLETHGLRPLVGPVLGRERLRMTEDLPYVGLVRQAVKAMGLRPSTCTLVSRSVGGMHTARDAGLRAIGVVSEHGRRKQLAAAGGLVVSSLPRLADALLAVPVVTAR
ncbi:HAD family hydrolase [Streptosporangium sp. NPDC004379]|uniref:HAD family hydrolase n=1 Tax=Streptosporangium sp. NPDC004379 TaxID=3366189 RepID=UPI0036807349